MEEHNENNTTSKQRLTLELINEPLKLKKNGDTNFKNFNFVQGVDQYNAAIEKVNFLLSTFPQEFNTEYQNEKKEIDNVAIGCHLNLGLCYMKMEDYDSCIMECDEVLKLDKTNCTALFRRCKCHIELENLEESVKDLDELKKHCKDKKDVKELEKEMKIKFKFDFFFIIRQLILMYFYKIYSEYIKGVPFVEFVLLLIKMCIMKPIEIGVCLLMLWKNYMIDIPISILNGIINFMKVKQDNKEGM